MTFSLLDAGGVTRTITKCKVLDGGTLRDIVRMKVMDTGDTLRTVVTFAQPLTLSISPDSAYIESFASNVLTAGPVTATPAGGLGPFTYSWATISGDATADSPSSASTYFTSSTLDPEVPETSVFRCTCTDNSGQTATADITAQFYFFIPG